MSDPILVDARGAADRLQVSERTYHLLRSHPLYPADTEVRLSARAVRFRVDRLREFAARLAAASARMPEPPRLRQGRERRAAAAGDPADRSQQS